MMDVNFIVTCYDHEDQWPFLQSVFRSYKTIKPVVAYCYNGTKPQDYACIFRCLNRGKQLGEIDLIRGGFNLLEKNSINHWIKIGVDCWLLDEQKLIDIFNDMEKKGCHYGGYRWEERNDRFGTEIFFALGNALLADFIKGAEDYISTNNKQVEDYMSIIAKKHPWYIIKERDKPFLRNSVPALGWTMNHSVNKNIEFAQLFNSQRNTPIKELQI